MEVTDQASQALPIPDMLTSSLQESNSTLGSQDIQNEHHQYIRQTFPPTPRSRSGSPSGNMISLDHRTLPLQTPPYTVATASQSQPCEKALPGASPRVALNRTRSVPDTPRSSAGFQIDHAGASRGSSRSNSARSAGNALSLILDSNTLPSNANTFPHTHSSEARPSYMQQRSQSNQTDKTNQTYAQPTSQSLQPSYNMAEETDKTVETMREDERLIEAARQYMTGMGGTGQLGEAELQATTPQARSEQNLMGSCFPNGLSTQNSTINEASPISGRSNGIGRHVFNRSPSHLTQTSVNQGSQPNTGRSHQQTLIKPISANPTHTVVHQSSSQPTLSARMHAIWLEQQQMQLRHQQQQQLQPQPQGLLQQQQQQQRMLTPAQQQYVLMQQGIVNGMQAQGATQGSWNVASSGGAPIMLRGPQVMVPRPQAGPSTVAQQFQNVYSPSRSQAPYSQQNSQTTPVRIQHMAVQITSPTDMYARSVNPNETHGPGHAQPRPLQRMPTPTYEQMDPSGYALGGPRTADSSQTVEFVSSRSAPRSREDKENVASASSEGNLDLARLCGSTWKECGSGIVKEYALLKHYQLGLRDLMRQSSEVFYEGLSHWLLSLPPQTRLKDVFQANISVQNSETGMINNTPYLSTPLTVILEQYRDLDNKIVEYHMRNERALDEFEFELRKRLEAGLQGLMDVEAIGLTSIIVGQEGQNEGSNSQASLDGAGFSSSDTTRRAAPMPVEISENSKILRRIHEIGDMNVYVDSNGQVHVHQKDQQIQTTPRRAPKPRQQPSNLPSQYLPHTPSFPQGLINTIDTNSGADGLPTWLLQSKHTEQGQTGNTSSSSVKQGSRVMARRQVQAKASGSQTVAHQDPDETESEPTLPKRGTKAGRAPVIEKITKKTKFGKRRAEEMESDADYEKPKKAIRPSPKQKKKA